MPVGPAKQKAITSASQHVIAGDIHFECLGGHAGQATGVDFGGLGRE